MSLNRTMSTTPTHLVGWEAGGEVYVGPIGEFKTSSILAAAGVAVLTATGKTVTSVELTAGEWDVSANLDRALTGVTATVRVASLSLTADTVAPAGGGSGLGTNGTVIQNVTFGTTITGGYTQVVGPCRVVLTATTTVYLVCHDTFSAGTMTAYGTIHARRIR